MEISNAVIRSVELGIEDHGILTAFLHLEHERGHQGFGGYILYSPNSGRDVSGKFIWRCLEVLEVRDWNDLKGKSLRIKIGEGLIRSIGHVIKDQWFTPSEELL